MSDKAWRESLYAEYSAHFGAQKPLDPAIQENIYPAYYRDLFDLPGSHPVLDVGCGRGEWLRWLKNQGWRDLEGVDLSAAEVALNKDPDLQLFCAEVNQFLAHRHNEFGLIHAKDLLEHLDRNEAIAFCRSALEALVPGGQLVLATFNGQAPLAAQIRYGDLTHEVGYTPSSLLQLLRACGFKEVAVRGVHPCPAGIKGQIRKFMYQSVELCGRFVLTLRHGKGTFHSQHSCHTDLIAVARKR